MLAREGREYSGGSQRRYAPILRIVLTDCSFEQGLITSVRLILID
ncbi:hypothetical protein [Methanocalculus natronophilus]